MTDTDTYTIISLSPGGYREIAPEVTDLRSFREAAEKSFYTIIEIRKNRKRDALAR